MDLSVLGDVTMTQIGNAVNSALNNRKIGSIVNKNMDLRTMILMRNIGKYSMWDGELFPQIGMMVNPYEREMVRPIDVGHINGSAGYYNGLVYDGVINDGGIQNVSRYSSTDDVTDLLRHPELLTKEAIAESLIDAINSDTDKKRLVYTSNAGHQRGGRATFERTKATIDDYLDSEHYINNSFVPKWTASGSSKVEISNGIKEKIAGKSGDKISFVYHESGTDNEEMNVGSGDEAFGERQTFIEDNAQYNDNTGFAKNQSIIDKTNFLFRRGAINSIINRFHTEGEDGRTVSEIQSAVNSEYGLSRGRNLLRKNPKVNNIVNGYDNPYCRVWTSHHQYSQMKDRIRPFADASGDSVNFVDVEGVQDALYDKELRPMNGGKRLGRMSVLKKNGTVNITPSNDNGSFEVESIKRCMFSIENLAWKDINFSELVKREGKDTSTYGSTLTKEQRGPNGGRIMWFPPYNLKFNENESANWHSNSFIGRGEEIYAYANTVRSGNLSFTLLVDHPSVLSEWGTKIGGNSGSNDEVEEDILRFFAGCQLVPEIGEEKNTQTQTVKRVTKNIVKEAPEYTEIKVAVFFPNNLTGADAKNDYDRRQIVQYLIDGTVPDFVEDRETNKIRAYEGADGGSSTDSIITACREKGLYWYYLVDNDYKCQVLRKGNYKDTKSYQLNVNKNGSLSRIKTALGSTDSSFNINNIYTFDELATAIDNKLSGSTADTKRVSDLQNIFAAQTVKPEISIEGIATHQGSGSTSQSVVAINRANFVKDWLIDNLTYGQGFRFNSSDISADEHVEIVPAETDINTPEAKKNRSAVITFKFKQSEDLGVDRNNTQEYDIPEAEVTASTTTPVSYDDEYRYFNELKENDPLAYQKVTDKVRYFTPAFHSITPEGFNARLTFLHQCTRQGPTNNSAGLARNLSFGRPPYCVLRIGDFYNTKILIDNIQMNYNDSNWDLNPEGVGVQPMSVDIDISFKFVGGSDISGPIERLQNAVSFNYYSNTSIYDRRADYRESFIDEGSGAQVNTWSPNLVQK